MIITRHYGERPSTMCTITARLIFGKTFERRFQVSNTGNLLRASACTEWFNRCLDGADVGAEIKRDYASICVAVVVQSLDDEVEIDYDRVVSWHQ